MEQMLVPYPVDIRGALDEPVNRWMFLVKWLLLIPHLVVLCILGVVLVVTWVVAGFAILITGRYPRALFDFNTGVLRWSWRVGFYGYQALGTDRYPPFTLAAVDDYPADLEVAYPEHLSRGLVLVKWWLLVIPQLMVVNLLTQLTGLLVFFAAVANLFTGRYPTGIFDFVLGMNRWTYRVYAYTLLATDAYPPFHLG